MLAKKNRLPLNASSPFSGQKSSDTHLTIIYKHNNLGYVRAAVIVSKKISPLAVNRNRYKRLILENFIQQYKINNSSLDMLFLPHKSLPLNSSAISQSIKIILDKINQWHGMLAFASCFQAFWDYRVTRPIAASFLPVLSIVKQLFILNHFLSLASIVFGESFAAIPFPKVVMILYHNLVYFTSGNH